MALPIDFDNLRSDESSERASSLEDYKVTCMEFIKDISGDYLEWVDYYKLPVDEDKKRRSEIAAVIERTNNWIAKVAQTIKGVDVVMNDGVQKMAEATAGKPFQIGVFINNKSEYVMAKSEIIDVNLKAAGRNGRKTKLGFHHKDQRFRIETTGKAFFDESNIPTEEFDFMDIHLKLNAKECKQRDVISFTVIVSEMENNQEMDRRGASTIIHII
ncbi:MAG: hypothetical protein ACE5RN_08605 [Nitrosopumilaceae archaeon]